MRFILGAVSGLLILIAGLLLINSRNAIDRLLYDELFLLTISALLTLAVLCLAAAGIIDRLTIIEQKAEQQRALLEDLVRRRARRARIEDTQPVRAIIPPPEAYAPPAQGYPRPVTDYMRPAPPPVPPRPQQRSPLATGFDANGRVVTPPSDAPSDPLPVRHKRLIVRR